MSPLEHAGITDEDARKIAKAVVHETLLTLGADTQNPLELQADFKFMRTLRKTHERVGVKILISIITLFITATGALLLVGLTTWIRKA